MNPHYAEIYSREGTLYHAGWAFITERSTPPGSPYFTRKDLIQSIVESTGCTESKASAAAGVLLSPSVLAHNQSCAEPGQFLSDLGRGDCRGNFSSQGNLYAILSVPVYGKNEAGKKIRVDTKYKVQLRNIQLPSRKRDTMLTDEYLERCISTLQALRAQYGVVLPAWASDEVVQETGKGSAEAEQEAALSDESVEV